MSGTVIKLNRAKKTMASAAEVIAKNFNKATRAIIMKTLKLIKQYKRLLEQDEVEEVDVGVMLRLMLLTLRIFHQSLRVSPLKVRFILLSC